MKRKKQKIRVDYLMDGTVCTDFLTGSWSNVRIHEDGRGYVKIPGEIRIYARVERISVTGRDDR